MEDAQLKGAEQAVQNMLFYYFTALEKTIEDPKQYIATRLPDMINLSEDQALFVKSNISTKSKVITGLTSSIELLNNMKKSNQYDANAMDIVIKLLTAIKTECEKTLELFTVKEDTDNA